MFSSWKQKLLLGFYILLLLSVPTGAYLASQNQNPNAAAKEKSTKKSLASLEPLTSTPSAQTNPLNIQPSEAGGAAQPSSIPSNTFGPTLNLKLVLEGRPAGKMASKLFVGIAEGEVGTSTPKYVLSFNIDLPDTGLFEGLSLAGLTAGNTYSAILKGPAQIATSSAFTMSPSVSSLNGGSSITLLTGDLNEDNVINSTDYSIATSAYGANATSANWNGNVDFNVDGVINIADISIIIKNMSTTGTSGVWTSPTPPSTGSSLGSSLGTATSSGSPKQGYWFWMPGI